MSLTDSVEDKLSDQKASPARSRERLSTPEKRLHFRHSESETDLPGDVDSVFAEGDKENSLTTQVSIFHSAWVTLSYSAHCTVL
uniref:Uncharacterized protein n=1 Tax=Octopus bimaculoides TaxID=37653 RepID=A0A0L8I8V6_OCTBM